MAQSSQERLFPADDERRFAAHGQPPSSTSFSFELYGDATVTHGGSGLGLRLSLGPYQLLFDCGEVAAALLLKESTAVGQQFANQPVSEALIGSQNQSAELPGAGQEARLAEPPVDFVFCSHAHGDHSRGLLALHRAWPQLPMLASRATCHLLPLNWPDEDVPVFYQGLDWATPHALADDLMVELFPAGHLPGAAVMVVTYWPELPQNGGTNGREIKPIRVAYLGDCFLSATRCSPGLALDELRGLKPELLITEGTYGIERYPRRRQQENEWVEQLLTTLERERFVLMPVATLGLAQELIVLLRSHHHCTGQAFDIWVDEPVAQGCDRYLDLLAEMPQTTQNFAGNQSLFWDDRVRPYVHRLAASGLERAARPGLVLMHPASDWGQLLQKSDSAWELWLDRADRLSSSASGWATHRAFALQSPESLRVLASFLQTGALHLNSYQLTDHCDGLGTTQLIHNLKPQHLLLVHGGHEGALQDLSDLEELRSRYRVHLAEPGVEVSLSVSDSAFQPTLSQQYYDGELQEDSHGIRLHLADEVAQDPRWQALSETGLLEVEWQGDGLFIRGLSPKELLGAGDSQSNQQGLNRRPTDCCKTCCFYRHQYCRNPDSPLDSVRVLAEGYCQEFQRSSGDR